MDQMVSPEDPFYSLDKLAISTGQPVTNEGIDQIVYEN